MFSDVNKERLKATLLMEVEMKYLENTKDFPVLINEKSHRCLIAG